MVVQRLRWMAPVSVAPWVSLVAETRAVRLSIARLVRAAKSSARAESHDRIAGGDTRSEAGHRARFRPGRVNGRSLLAARFQTTSRSRAGTAAATPWTWISSMLLRWQSGSNRGSQATGGPSLATSGLRRQVAVPWGESGYPGDRQLSRSAESHVLRFAAARWSPASCRACVTSLHSVGVYGFCVALRSTARFLSRNGPCQLPAAGCGVWLIG